MALPIITDEKILRAKNELVKPNEIDYLINELEQSLEAHPIAGAGLAAPQIGINKQIAIVRVKTTDLDISFNLINPIIVDRLQGFIHKDEGCLSIPNERFNTWRYKEIVVEDYLQPAGMILTGIEAVVALHEIDHLNGILVKDRQIGKNKIGRNDPCPCGRKVNNKVIKYKKCHWKI